MVSSFKKRLSFENHSLDLTIKKKIEDLSYFAVINNSYNNQIAQSITLILTDLKFYPSSLIINIRPSHEVPTYETKGEWNAQTQHFEYTMIQINCAEKVMYMTDDIINSFLFIPLIQIAWENKYGKILSRLSKEYRLFLIEKEYNNLLFDGYYKHGYQFGMYLRCFYPLFYSSFHEQLKRQYPSFIAELRTNPSFAQKKYSELKKEFIAIYGKEDDLTTLKHTLNFTFDHVKDRICKQEGVLETHRLYPHLLYPFRDQIEQMNQDPQFQGNSTLQEYYHLVFDTSLVTLNKQFKVFL